MDKDNIFEVNKYRVKRMALKNSENPVQEISNRINDLFEKIQENNKRFKPQISTEFKCDLFRFEDSLKDRIYNVINPRININVQINNDNQIFNNSIQSNNLNKKKDEEIKNKMLSEKDKLNQNIQLNNRNTSRIETVRNNNNLVDLPKNDNNKQETVSLFHSSKIQNNNIENNTSFFGNGNPFSSNSIQKMDENIPDNSRNLFGDRNSFPSNNLQINEEIQNKQTSSLINLSKREVKIQEPAKNLFQPGTIFSNISSNNNNPPPSNIQIQINLPPNNPSLQISNNPSHNEPNITNQTPIISSNVLTSNQNQSKSLQAKLVTMSENYNKIKLEIEKISQNSTYKNKINNIIDRINLKFNQISTDDTIQSVANEAIKTLRELERSNEDDLYIYTIDYICKRVITKAEGYSNDKKINIYRLSKIVSMLDQNIAIFGDYFISILTFRCPFLIPKIFLKKDCKSEEEYSKKMGFAYMTQNSNEHLSDMECHSYLFYGFLKHDINKKYYKYIECFTQNLFTEACIYPLAAVVNAFLDSFGTVFKEKYENLYNEFAKKIVDFLKILENVKNTCKSSDIKAKISTYIHFIKKNLDLVKKNLPTAMFKQ